MKPVLWIVILVMVVGGAYLYRSQLQALFTGASPAPVSYTYSAATPTGAPTTGGTIISWKTGTKGQFSTGPTGMTLYRFDRDTAGVSNCSGSCAGIWPPYITSSKPATLPANVTIITRGDGSMQFAYKGSPLYYYSGDVKVGDINGDGFNGIWHLVSP